MCKCKESHTHRARTPQELECAIATEVDTDWALKPENDAEMLLQRQITTEPTMHDNRFGLQLQLSTLRTSVLAHTGAP
jgi:hypothetical protein